VHVRGQDRRPTWRDGEGRLIWGINDFDEATALPYTNDLVRLCTSALIAISEARLETPSQRACDSVLEGYTEALRDGGEPVVLAERNRWLRDLAVGRLKEQRAYWERLLKLGRVSVAPTPRQLGFLRQSMPESRLPDDYGVDDQAIPNEIGGQLAYPFRQ